MPFVTEEIYRNLINDDDSIMISAWPVYDESMEFAGDERYGAHNGCHKSGQEHKGGDECAPVKEKQADICCRRLRTQDTGRRKRFIERLAGASEIVIQADKSGVPDDAVTAVLAGAEIFIPLEDLVDIAKELERLEKEKANLEKELERVNSKLSNEGFISKAPAKVVEEEQAKKVRYSEMYEKVLARIAILKK